MPLLFYPHDDDLDNVTLEERLDVLMDAAERYKAAILDAADKAVTVVADPTKRNSPKDVAVAFNWEELAKGLREIRELPEGMPVQKAIKSDRLKRLANVYDVLRSAKMPKLEAVRIALVNEASQLSIGAV